MEKLIEKLNKDSQIYEEYQIKDLFSLYEEKTINDSIIISGYMEYYNTITEEEVIGKFYYSKFKAKQNGTEDIYNSLKEQINCISNKIYRKKMNETYRHASNTERNKAIRSFIKDSFEDVKFSIRKDSGTIYISLVEAKENPFKEELQTEYQINKYYLIDDNNLKNKFKKMFLLIDSFITLFHYDESDAQIDYFNTNFYYQFSVGSYNKSFKIS